MTWPTVHEHIVADAFRSKKSLSALLLDEIKHRKVVIQLLVVTAREIYLRTQEVCAKHLNVER